ncbi:transaminase activity protein [[Candida] boidinii]|nr:transaminase activity protein [[Candida] boidinii]OWB61205.1 transaminase activity protein [[Candida] boidinii]
MTTDTTTEFVHENLIAKRAAKRFSKHFWRNAVLPEGVKPHPNPISLAGGVPHHELFPINSIDVHISKNPFPKGYRDEAPDVIDDITDASTIDTFTIPQVTANDKIIDIKNGLQYQDVGGTPTILKLIKDFIKRVSNPGYDENQWNTILTCGSGNGIMNVFDLLLDEDDTLLVEEFSFTPVLAGVRNIGATPIPIKLTFEQNNLDLNYLSNLLDNWSELYPNLKKPKLLYTIANGQNPTGLAQDLETKKKVYELACKHDFIILEDDPYGYLFMPPYNDSEESTPIKMLTNDEFIDSIYPSYLKIDTTGRVIRAETFSKVFSPGLRLGFLVAHKRFIKVIEHYMAITTRTPSGSSQLLVNNTIQHLGGIEGWIQWIIKVRNEYVRRRNALVKGLKETESYKNAYIKIIDPHCGMFVSVIINFDKLAPVEKLFKIYENYDVLLDKLNVKCVINGVGIVLGTKMSFDDESLKNGNFVRLALSFAPNTETLTEAGHRLGKAVEDLFDDLKTELN